MIGSLGWMEITVIAIIALLLVGPKGLPKLGKSIGGALRDFKKEAKELKQAIEIEVDEDDRQDQQAKAKERRTKAAAAAKSPAGNDKAAAAAKNPKEKDKPAE
jgi:sec-independent protein translocase protein TatA